MIRKIPICVTNALSYHCKITKKHESFIGLGPDFFNDQIKIAFKFHICWLGSGDAICIRRGKTL